MEKRRITLNNEGGRQLSEIKRRSHHMEQIIEQEPKSKDRYGGDLGLDMIKIPLPFPL